MSIHTTSVSGSNSAPTAAHLNSSSLELLDMSDAIRDKSLPIHTASTLSINCGEAVGHIRVFDLEHVYAHPKARVAIKNAYLMPLFLVEAFAQNYRTHLLRKLTRGNNKGLLILDPEVNTYVHRLSDGSDLVVQGATIQVNGTYTRSLTISCRGEKLQGGLQ